MHGVIAMKLKPGPKPKAGERYPSGKLKPNQPTEGWSPTHIRRAMDNAFITAGLPAMGDQIKLMLMKKEITPRQASAAIHYAYVIGRRARVVDEAPRRHVKSPAYDQGYRAVSDIDIERLRAVDPEAADKVEAKIAAEKRDILRKYELVVSAIPKFPMIAKSVVDHLCLDDKPVHWEYLDTLRIILDRIAKAMKIEETEDSAPAKPAPAAQDDAGLYGMAAVEALERHFEQRGATITEYDVMSAKRGQWRRIWACGHTADGEVVEHHIDIEVHGMLGAALERRLVMFAESKGWKRRAQ